MSRANKTNPSRNRLHLLAELKRIDYLIRFHVERALSLGAGGEWAGLAISEEEVDTLSSGPAGLPVWATMDRSPATRRALDELERDLRKEQEVWQTEGVTLRLEELALGFGLSAFERDVIVLCLAPELDLKYQRLFAYLHDDVTRKRPSVDLALNLLSPDFGTKIDRRSAFAARAPLRRFGLLTWGDEQAGSLLSRTIGLEERVVSFLLEEDRVEERLPSWAELSKPGTRLDDLVVPEKIRTILELHAAAPGGHIFYFHGPAGAGKRRAAEAFCRRGGWNLLVIDSRELMAQDDEKYRGALEWLGREARLRDAAILCRRFEILLDSQARSRRSLFFEILTPDPGHGRPLFLSARKIWEPGSELAHIRRVDFPALSAASRAVLWGRHLGVSPEQEVVRDLAGRFSLDGAKIRDAAITARRLALLESSAAFKGNGASPEADTLRLDSATLERACRMHSDPNLESLAVKITPHYSWDDLVLPDQLLEQLREVDHQVRYRARVYGEWGFEKKLALGKGVNVLFQGPSGTGKTMAADVIAGELGLALYKIDLSNVVSKYIGETEKNLSALFDEAETSGAVLFFDEADALFGKRSEVRDAHDRYANIEVSYLLQRMEAYRGIVILATNLADNLDEAFVRRMHFVIEFPFPEEAERRRIWEGIWPHGVPLCQKVDLGLLARRFEITGGNIRNVALAATFLAAADGGIVNMQHLLHAAHREYRKMGRLALGREFEN